MELEETMPDTRFHRLLSPLASLAGFLVLFILEKASQLLEHCAWTHSVHSFLLRCVVLGDRDAPGGLLRAA
jgi:hypothetical protein